MNIGIIGISLKGICKMKTVVEKLENLRNKMKENEVRHTLSARKIITAQSMPVIILRKENICQVLQVRREL